jgi:hypothetical protein
VTKFHHLIGDRKFIIRTDHKNLVYIRDTGSPKVMRWKYKIQGYDFEIEYLEGSLNDIADGFSRILVHDEDALRAAKGKPPLTTEYVCGLWEHYEPGLKVDDVEAEREFTYKHTTLPKRERQREQRDGRIDEQLNALGEFQSTIPAQAMANLEKVHGGTAGHRGIVATLARLEELNLTWPHMRQHVRQFIKQCPCCQKMSEIRVPVITRPFTSAAYHPMQKVSIDTIGPVKLDDAKNCHILVIVDCFTRSLHE